MNVVSDTGAIFSWVLIAKDVIRLMNVQYAIMGLLFLKDSVFVKIHLQLAKLLVNVSSVQSKIVKDVMI